MKVKGELSNWLPFFCFFYRIELSDGQTVRRSDGQTVRRSEVRRQTVGRQTSDIQTTGFRHPFFISTEAERSIRKSYFFLIIFFRFVNHETFNSPQTPLLQKRGFFLYIIWRFRDLNIGFLPCKGRTEDGY